MTKYVFDNSPLSVLFKNYYRSRFPTLWSNFDALVAEGRLLSTREAMREIEDGASDECRIWAASNSALFASPTGEEGAFVARIFAVPHFQQNIEQRKILQGGKNADPFVIARAAVVNASVVTMETMRPNGSGIPNICDHFRVPWLSLEQFMEAEGWTFQAIQVLARPPRETYAKDIARAETPPTGKLAAIEALVENAITLCADGSGRITNIPQPVWEFAISGYRVLPRWLAAREGVDIDENFIPELRDVAARIAELLVHFAAADSILDETLADSLTREALGVGSGEGANGDDEGD